MSQQTTPGFAAADLTDPNQALLDAVMTISSDLDLRNMLTRILGAAGSLSRRASVPWG